MERIERQAQTSTARTNRPYRTPPRRARQRGAFAVMMVFLIMVILGFCGLAIDLGRMYHRKIELQKAADTIALAAAKELDGTTAGVTRARSAASQAMGALYFNYSLPILWSESAIRFGATPDSSSWVDAATANLATHASTMFYARVDTNELDDEHGAVRMMLLRLFTGIGDTSQVGSVATAGRSSMNVAPLAVCAMSDTPGEARGTELVEFGFRRGVSYNLMKLNPNATTKGAHYLVNPVALPGQAGAAVSARLDVIRPFVCIGKLGVPIAPGGLLNVEEDFPLASLYEQLNSRFGSYADPCVAGSAPPDTNIKQFGYGTAFPWMDKAPTGQAAETRLDNGRMQTVADLPATEIPATTSGGMYGPLWVYARAVVKDSRYVSGSPEPASGYTKFNPTDWPTLYSPGSQQVKAGRSYPSTPFSTSIEAPAVPGVANRRVLNVPLLRCMAPLGASGPAEVRAIAKFFMTVSATQDDLYAEFAGLAPSTSLGGQVRLYP